MVARYVQVIDPEVERSIRRCHERIAELSSLEDGWFDGDGVSIAREARDAAGFLLEKRPGLAADCRIFPTLEGGILIEFVRNGWDLSVEFMPDGKVEFYGVEIDGIADLAPVCYEGITDSFIAALDARAGH